MASRRIFHVDESGCATDRSCSSSIEHQKAVRQGVIIHVGLSEVFLVLVQLVHL